MRRFVPFMSTTAIVSAVAAVAYAFTGAAQFDPNAACVGNAKLLASAVQHFEQDHDQHLPPTDSLTSFHAALLPYVTDTSVFVCPATHTDYAPNAAISGQALTAVGDLHTTVLFQDASPHADGKTTVAYVDGSVLYGGVEIGDINQICVDRADRVARGTLEYVQDNDESFPPMDTPAKFEAAVYPYVKSHIDFVCPSSNKPFVPNVGLNGLTLGNVASYRTTVLFSDPDAHADGIKTVAYVDGGVVHGTYHPQRLKGGTACADDLRQLGQAVGEYVQDNDELLPVYKSYAQFTPKILPYTKSTDLFKCPDTGLDYAVNLQLSGIAPYTLANPGSTWLLRDVVMHDDGVFNTLTADGVVHTQFNRVPVALSVLPSNETRLLWYGGDGQTRIWTLDAAGAFEKSVTVKADANPIVAMTTDTKLRTLALRASANTDTLQFLDANGNTFKSPANGPYDGWDPIGVGIGPNWQGHLLWKKFDGTASVWTLKADGTYMTDVKYGPIANTKVVALASAPDNSQRLLWFGDNGIPQVWSLDGGGNIISTRSIASMAGWTPKSIAVGPDNVARVMWTSLKHSMRIWKVPASGKEDRTVFIQAGGDWQPISFAVGNDGNYRVLFAGSAGALVGIVDPAGNMLSSHVFARP